MVLPRRLVPTLPSLRHRRVRMSRPSEGERARQRETERETETNREKRNKGKGKRDARGGGWGTNAGRKERKRDRNETVGPRVGCSPNSSTCPRDAGNNIVLISRHRGEASRASKFLTRARTSNDRDVIGRTLGPGSPRMNDFTLRAPGPGSEAAFREENFYRFARIERKRAGSFSPSLSRARTKILSDKAARRFDGIAVNARNCGTVERGLSCKSSVLSADALR